MNIFNPQICLSKYLKASWCCNVSLSNDTNQIPIDIVQGIPRLRLEHDLNSKHDWFACAIPVDSSWEASDISNFDSLNFKLYSDQQVGGLIRLEDSDQNESLDFDFTNLIDLESEVSIKVSLDRFFNKSFDPKKCRLLKIIGLKSSAFYISEVTLE